MTEQEFWASTPAKVFALRDRRDDLDRRRDYFVAELVALKLTSKDKYISANDILEGLYRPKAKPKEVVWNDALGADCNWQEMKEAMRAAHGS